MASCVFTIQEKINTNSIETIQQLFPNTSTGIVLTPSTKQLFRLEIVNHETVQFTISLLSTIAPTNVGVTVNFYQLNENNTLTFLGNAAITEMILSFQKDLTVGTYIICIGTTTFTYTGTFQGIFTSFPTQTKFKIDPFTGSTLSVDMSVPLPDRECNKVLYYEIVDGALPPRINHESSWDYFGCSS